MTKIPPIDSAPCPLCDSLALTYTMDHHRQYLRCPKCALVFVPPIYHLSRQNEKDRYDQHENSPEDAGYVAFLSRLYHATLPVLKKGDCGLDFGCGPGPTLHLLFEQNGYKMDIYDPNYAPNENVFTNQYDFITASEVIEHLYHPQREMNRLTSMLKSNGHLAFMTQFAPMDNFSTWHYRNDDTHVCFFSEQTFEFIAQRWQMDLTIPANGIALLKKK